MSEAKDTEMREIGELLNHLGITATYKGFLHTCYAVSLAMESPEYLALVTKRLYPEVAQHFGTSWTCVERNIRTVAQIAWESNRPALEEMAQYPLLSRPSSSRFLAMLVARLQRDSER